MIISLDKSSFLYNNVAEDIRLDIGRFLAYKMEYITLGFKYLGYFLKPLGYCVNDWKWLIQRYERKISHWAQKFLSMGGRLTLIQVVLSSIPVYWFNLAPIPVSVLNKLRSITFSFLWGSSDNHYRYPLSD